MTTYIDDIEFNLTYNYSRGMPGRRTLNNGDPGYPDEPETVEDIELKAIFRECDLAGQEFIVDYDKLPERIQNRIYDEICDYEREKKADQYAERYEYDRED